MEGTLSLKWEIKHVQVQTINKCNRSCAFCPSEKFPRQLKFMSLEIYQRVLAELGSLGFAGRFSPYLQGEPLLDNRLPQLLTLARAALPRAQLLIQTNGDALTVEKGLALFEAGLHKMIINCYEDQAQVARMRNLVTEMLGRQPDLRIVNGNLGRMIRPEQGQIRREIAIDDKTWWREDTAENWGGNIPGALGEPLRQSCVRPFQQLYVHANGDVVLCCCDWKGEVVFGNVMQASLSQIFSGPLATRYRQNLAQKNRKMKLCEVCNYRGDFHVREHLLLLLSRLGNKVRGALGL
jgi:radical SAM protein with 4Fe4S-binding SPASM domain